MTDYLIEAYNTEMSEIQNREIQALFEALELYVSAQTYATHQAVRERFNAGVRLAAAMSQRDHEYHNGRTPAPEDQKPEPDTVLTFPSIVTRQRSEVM
jgi:hypothetical protein